MGSMKTVLRQLLVRAGALRFQSNDGEEPWGYVSGMPITWDNQAPTAQSSRDLERPISTAAVGPASHGRQR